MRVRTGWWSHRMARPNQAPTSPTLDAPAPKWAGLGTAPTERADPRDVASNERMSPEDIGRARTTPIELPRIARASTVPGRRVEHFVLLERIGVGGMGEVYAAFDDRLERKVAIKLVATQRRDDRARQRLLREAQALARLSHPNVVTVYEVGTLPDGGLFIAMELVKGDTLRTWQRRPGRTWRDIVAMYAEAGRGLVAAHQSGIVHRDFKPDNVLVGDDGRVRVADFGLAFAARNTAAGAARPVKSLDTPGSPPPAQALTAAGR